MANIDLGDIEPTWCGVFLNHGPIWLPEDLSYSRPELGAELLDDKVTETQTRTIQPMQYPVTTVPAMFDNNDTEKTDGTKSNNFRCHH